VAERSGEVQVGDKIYAVDGHDAQRRSKEEVKSLFCGRPGTLLTLTILGSGGPVLGNEFKELMLERMQGVKIMVKEVQNLRFPKRTPQVRVVGLAALLLDVLAAARGS
jgi:C-terminal processing protease CtpA/Prc